MCSTALRRWLCMCSFFGWISSYPKNPDSQKEKVLRAQSPAMEAPSRLLSMFFAESQPSQQLQMEGVAELELAAHRLLFTKRCQKASYNSIFPKRILNTPLSRSLHQKTIKHHQTSTQTISKTIKPVIKAYQTNRTRLTRVSLSLAFWVPGPNSSCFPLSNSSICGSRSSACIPVVCGSSRGEGGPVSPSGSRWEGCGAQLGDGREDALHSIVRFCSAQLGPSGQICLPFHGGQRMNG